MCHNVWFIQAKERAPGTEIDGHKIRIDYSITERAHTPTPGVYLGRPTRFVSTYRDEEKNSLLSEFMQSVTSVGTD